MKSLKNWLTFVGAGRSTRSRSSLLGLLTASILLTGPVWATNRTPEPDPGAQADASADASAHAGAAAGASSESNITVNIDNGGGSADAQAVDGPTLNSTQEGDTVSTSTNNESNFFALSTTFPQVNGCFKGKQGGAAGSGTGIWFGGHGLDLNCFLTMLAESEPDIEVQARLKCGAKAYRNAIAFQEPKKDRQLYCVNYMTQKHRNELQALRERAEFLLMEKERIEHELIERNTILARQCADQLERSEEAWLECLAK